MTLKQEIKSIEKKMKSIEINNPDVDFALTSKYFFDIERYYKLRQEHFLKNFELEHCVTCGKKL